MGIIIIIGAVVFILVILYNSLVSKKNQVTNVFASVDTLLKKRYNLISNLISTVKTYMEHERGTLTEITALRAKATSSQLSDDDRVELDNKISKALGGIMIAVENYPDLKANQSFLKLQGSLNETEEQISAARRAYNAAVTDYNNAIEMFPINMLASAMNYKLKKVFEIAEVERKNVDVKGLFNSSR